MFKFINNKMENKFINILNAGWIAVELNPGNDIQKAWSFMSENGEFNVIAVYSKKTGKLQGINGRADSMMMFLSSTEEHDVCEAFSKMAIMKSYKETTPAGSGVPVKLFGRKF
jgi:hypothetical protein